MSKNTPHERKVYPVEDILNTITAFREARNWSVYDLAAHAEMKPTTISTWYNTNAIPTLPSLYKICNAFQITLSEFFAKVEERQLETVAVTPQQSAMLEKWSVLRHEQQEALLRLLETMP